jgi:hypothetical protein
MLPEEIEARIKAPGKLEKAFLQYLQDAKCNIDQSKTIATQVLYHQVELNGQSAVDFFTGNLDTANTNIVGSFVRPQSEHFVIYAIRIYQGSGSPSIYLPGYDQFDPVINPAYSNSYFSLQVNSVRVLKNVPVTEFDTENTNNYRGYFLLNEPIIWEGQTEAKLTLQAPQGTLFPADLAIRFEFVGIGLI